VSTLRPAPAVLALLLAGIAGCSDDPDFGEGRSPESTGPASINSREAAAEARSAASQDATRFDVSLPPGAFEAACVSPNPEAARQWNCTVRSKEGSCEGTVEVVAPGSGGIVTRRRVLNCTPPPE